ncbi:MAG TPA: hypothetical protein EYG39_12825 [Rhodothermales bacterium]|nr:hypothetical protein [Rhodothermales bacterium]
MILSLARLQLLAFWRAPYLGGRLALGAAKGIGVAYAVGSLAIIGFVWPDLMGVVLPAMDPVTTVEAFVLPALAALTVLRFLFQEVPTRAAEAFLLLPVSRRRVAAAVLARSLASPLNLVPLAFLVPFAGRAVRLADGPGAAWAVGGGAVLLVALSHFLFTIWKTRLGARPISTTLGVLGAMGAVAAAEVVSGGMLGAVREGAWGWLVGGALAVGVSGGVTYRALLTSLYLDHARPFRRLRQPGTLRLGFERPGVSAFAELDRQLIARTTFPRGIVGNAAVVSVALTIVALLVDVGVSPDLVLVFSTGTLAGSLGQYALPFASGHWDRLLTLPGALTSFVRAKWMTVGVGTFALGAAQLAVVLVLAPEKAWLVGVSVLFSLGVLAPAALWGSTLAPKPVDVAERLAFNYKAQSFGAQVAVASTAIAAGALIALAGPARGAALAAVLGAAGVAAAPLWLRALERRVRRTRHAVAARFRGAL